MSAPVEMVTVLIENSYACGRQSSEVVTVPAPASPEAVEAWWSDKVADLTGDGHPCGAREHSLYQVRVLTGPEWLVGRGYFWEDM